MMELAEVVKQDQAHKITFQKLLGCTQKAEKLPTISILREPISRARNSYIVEPFRIYEIQIDEIGNLTEQFHEVPPSVKFRTCEAVVTYSQVFQVHIKSSIARPEP